MACSEGLCAPWLPRLPVPGVPSTASSARHVLEWREDAKVPNHSSRSQSRGRGHRPPVSALGPVASGRSTLGPLYCGRGSMEGKSEHLMNVGSVQQAFIQFNQQFLRLYPLCAERWGFSRGAGDQKDRGLHPPQVCGLSESREHRSPDKTPTVAGMPREEKRILVLGTFKFHSVAVSQTCV